MPDLVEQMYCAEQIHIPPTFPFILKQYAKAAIRTQPYDLLRWSAAYFRAMANGDEPPVKLRLEYPPIELASGLTPGYLKVLLKQFEGQLIVREEALYDRWQGLCLIEDSLTDMLNLGRFDEEVDFLKFIAVAAGHLTNSLSQTMVLICELLTEEPEGGSAMIPCDIFCNLYSFLARLNCGPVTTQPEPAEELEETKEAEEVALEAVESVTDAAITIAAEAQDSAFEVLTETADRAIAVTQGLEAEFEKEFEEETEKKAEATDAAIAAVSGVISSIPTIEQARMEEIKKKRAVTNFFSEVAGIGPVVGEDQIESVVSYMKYWAQRQEGMVMPRNIRHFLCPLLDPVGTVQSLEAEK